MYHCKKPDIAHSVQNFYFGKTVFPKVLWKTTWLYCKWYYTAKLLCRQTMSANFTLVCCVRHAFQVLRCVNNGSGQTACRLFSRLYLIVAKVVAVQISPFKPTFVITETQFTRGVPSRVLMLVCWKFWYGVPFLRHCVQFGAIQLHKQRFCCLGTAIFRCCGAKRSNQALAICFAVFCQVAEQKLMRCQFCLSKLPCFTVEPRQRYKMHVI